MRAPVRITNNNIIKYEKSEERRTGTKDQRTEERSLNIKYTKAKRTLILQARQRRKRMYLNTYDSSWKPERLSNESQRKKAHKERGCTTGIFKKQINT